MFPHPISLEIKQKKKFGKISADKNQSMQQNKKIFDRKSYVLKK
jgi:hypothetical protein